MTAYDLIAEADADDECRLWVRKLINARDEIVAFVDARLDGQGAGEYLGFFKGSFNISFHIGFGEGKQSVLIRFPKPGHTLSAWREEKVANEVRVIEYLREHTTIPVPCVRCWGLADDSPAQLGPFMIMDFIQDVRLSTFLKQPTNDDQADPILNPALDEMTLDTIYDQPADYLLQLSRLEFPSIGAISKNPTSNTWSVTGRPLTFNMNELATNTGYPTDHFPTTPFTGSRAYFNTLARQHLLHLKTQRNLCGTSADVRRRLIARRQFQQRLIPKNCTDDDTFKLFCDDLQPSNILLDPKTLRITALLDWEFANSMPAQFGQDPPWWLLLRGPDFWLDEYSMEEFLERYVPRMEQFLRAVERVEGRAEGEGGVASRERCLSGLMRESWATGRFWFNYAARTSLDMDDIYWAALHDSGTDEDGTDGLDAPARAEMEELVELKMAQRIAYDEEYDVRFPEKEESMR